MAFEPSSITALDGKLQWTMLVRRLLGTAAFQFSARVEMELCGSCCRPDSEVRSLIQGPYPPALPRIRFFFSVGIQAEFADNGFDPLRRNKCEVADQHDHSERDHAHPKCNT